MNSLATEGLAFSSCEVRPLISLIERSDVPSRMTAPTWNLVIAVTVAAAIPAVGQSTMNSCPTRSAKLIPERTFAALGALGFDELVVVAEGDTDSDPELEVVVPELVGAAGDDGGSPNPRPF